MDFDKFQTLFLSQLKINDERCLETIDSNIELIEVYLGEKGNQKIIRNFAKEISDIIFNSKNLTDILQNDLYKKVLSHPSFSYILRILNRTFKLIRACKNKNIGDANSYQMLEICPYIQDSNGVSTLMYAGELNLNYAIERYLDDARALNLEDNDGNNLLFYCVRNPYFVSNDLVSNNKYGNDLVNNSEIDINHVNHQGESVLIYCAKNEIIKPISKFLIHCNKIDPNIVDNDGKTAAMYLTEKGHTYELLGLYRRNYNYDYINEKGQSALSILFDRLYTVEDSTSYSNYIRVLSIFTKYQCDFNNAIDIDGNTPFMLTLIVNDMDTAKYLIKSIKKLDLSVKNKFGENAISLCYKLGCYFYLS